MSKCTDCFRRVINLGDFIFWRGKLCVIRGFGKTDLPHVTYRVKNWGGPGARDRNDCVRISSAEILKVEDNWLMEFPNREEIMELMRIRHEILTKANAKKET